MKNPKWPAALGQLYNLDTMRGSAEAKRTAATKALEQLEIAYKLTTDVEFRSLYLTYIAKTAFAANKPASLDNSREARNGRVIISQPFLLECIICCEWALAWYTKSIATAWHTTPTTRETI